MVGAHESVAMDFSRLCSVVRTIESTLTLAAALEGAVARDDNDDGNDDGDIAEAAAAVAGRESADAGRDEDNRGRADEDEHEDTAQEDAAVASRTAYSFRKPRMRGSTISSSSICRESVMMETERNIDINSVKME